MGDETVVGLTPFCLWLLLLLVLCWWSVLLAPDFPDLAITSGVL